MPRVFISYSHDHEAHRQRVREFAERVQQELGGHGYTVILDQWVPDPDEGWPKWCEDQVEGADKVLVVITRTYRRRYDGEEKPGLGLGATFEASIIRQLIWDAGAMNPKFRVILFDPADEQHIPSRIKGHTCFQPWVPDSYARLLAWLTGANRADSASSPTAPAAVTWPAPAVQYRWPLADRVHEFEYFQEVVSGREARRIILLHGPSNTGKTAVVTELFKLAKQIGLERSLLDLKGCPTIEALLDNLALDIGAAILPQFHAAETSRRSSRLLADLQVLRVPVFLVFDTYQHASTEVADWLEGQLLTRIEKCPGLVVLLSGQKVPDPGRFGWQASAALRPLAPIQNVKDWQEYVDSILGRGDVTQEHLEMLIHIYGGDPGKTSSALQTFTRVASVSPSSG